MEDHTTETLGRARRLRRTMSLPEGLLWNRLKGKPMGVKFRSQHPIGNFVVDFYCAQKRLAFEIDGIAHDMGDRPQCDLKRDAELNLLGVEVIRIAATDVLRKVDAIAESIVALCLDRPPPSALCAATSPSGGDSLGVAC